MKKEVTPELLRKSQLCMLHILKKVHEICEKHNIKYWLDYGTLLGAVRHDGFIPWDDDLDISMLREDYEKWCKIAQEELGNDFFWQTHETEPCYHLLWGKVRLTGTRWFAAALKRSSIKHKGVNIDIFPIDYMPKSRSIRKVIDVSHKCLATVLVAKYLRGGSWRLLKDIVCFFINIKLFQKICRFLATKVNEKNKENVSMWYMNTEKYLCSAETFSNLTLHKFEDSYFYIPKDYDSHLKRLYGNYMQLPPVEERTGKHFVECCDLGKYSQQ